MQCLEVGPGVATCSAQGRSTGASCEAVGGSLAAQTAVPADYATVFTNAKAGMQGVDKEKVKQVVYDMSKDSKHFQEEERKQAKVKQRIDRMKAALQEVTPEQLKHKEAAMDAELLKLESHRDLTRFWLHVDMDAFYAAVEERDNPALKEVPVAVGSIGMVCTANYKARTFGVRAAMPGFIGRKLCPNLVFVKPDFKKYTAAAAVAREVFASIDPDFVSRGLDEAALDSTEYCAANGVTPQEVAAHIRTEVQRRTQLTCSVGIAPNIMIAKVASDMNKPNGQFEVASTRPAVMAFIHDLSIRKVQGIGKVTEQMLAAFGVRTVADLHAQRAVLAAVFSPISVDFFLHVMLGLGSTHAPEKAAEGEVSRKGISHERTFAAISKRSDLEDMARHLAARLAEDVAKEGLAGKNLTLKLKDTGFQVRTRAVTLPTYISSQQSIEAAALKLLARELPIEIRLMGIRLSSFRSCPVTPSQPKLTTLLVPPAQATPSAAGATTCCDPDEAEPAAHKHDAALQPTSCGAHSPGMVALESEADLAEANEAAAGPILCQVGACEAVSAAPSVRAGLAETSMPDRSQQPANPHRADHACGSESEHHLHRADRASTVMTAGPCDAHSDAHNSTASERVASAAAVVCAGEPHDAQHGLPPAKQAASADEAFHTFICGECGAQMPRSSEQEHRDWHVAQQLSAAMNGAGYISGAGRGTRQSGAGDGLESRGERSGEHSGVGEKRRGGRSSGKKRQASEDAPSAQLLKYFAPKARVSRGAL